jgi:hypothetical protein
LEEVLLLGFASFILHHLPDYQVILSNQVFFFLRGVWVNILIYTMHFLCFKKEYLGTGDMAQVVPAL